MQREIDEGTEKDEDEIRIRDCATRILKCMSREIAFPKHLLQRTSARLSEDQWRRRSRRRRTPHSTARERTERLLTSWRGEMRVYGTRGRSGVEALVKLVVTPSPDGTLDPVPMVEPILLHVLSLRRCA